MNIDDVSAPSERPSDLLGAIFAYQREHLESYLVIENKSGIGLALLTEASRTNLNLGNGIDIHCRYSQAVLKDYAWRVTEELTEAAESGEMDPVGEFSAHTVEEIIDALHFLVELSILVGYQPENTLENLMNPLVIPYEFTTFSNASFPVIVELGKAMNCLKNKPWKQTHMLTDRLKFETFIRFAWLQMCQLLHHTIGAPEQVYDLYFRKSTVNSFRQRSKY